MMIGERNHGTVSNYLSPIHVPPWTLAGDETNNLNSFNVLSPSAFSDDHSLFLTALQRYLPSNTSDAAVSDDDDFRMYEFKVRKCTRGRSHDWTECPYAHPGEKARRRDPRTHHYAGSACPEFRRGSCLKGDACEHAHGVFECWLHPARYRTQLCKDGAHCTRRVCFFAHAPEQLRVLSPRAASVGSPEGELVGSMRQLQLSKVNSMPSSWRLGGGGVLSPRINLPSPPNGYMGSSMPGTPTRGLTRPGFGLMGSWGEEEEEGPVLERVESGRGLREKMFEKLSKENPLDRVEPSPNQTPSLNVSLSTNLDVGWVSDLLN